MNGKILITGGTGFVGRNVKEYFENKGYDIYAPTSKELDCLDEGKLIEICNSGFENVTEYELFIRCISEQTIIENGKRRLLTKEDGIMNATAL